MGKLTEFEKEKLIMGVIYHKKEIYDEVLSILTDKFGPIDDMTDLATEDEVSQGVFEALSRLSEKYRTVILLHHLEGFSIDEISKALSLSKSAVKMRLSRGRELLKERIDPIS